MNLPEILNFEKQDIMKISAVIITYNEERNIERCLLSLLELADEIVVLDSFSTDKTEEICKKYPVKFIQHAFDGHIEQKNRAMNAAKYSYVLSLDADEFLSEKLKKSILAIKENAEFDAYSFNRLNYYCQKPIKHSGWYPDKKIRLWNKSKGSWGGINPHDSVILENHASLKHLKGDLNHFSYNTIEEHIAQTNKFSTISAQALFEKGKKASIIKIWLKTFGAFIKNYILKLAFLDGFYGLVIARTNTYATFLKYSKLRDLTKRNQNKTVASDSL